MTTLETAIRLMVIGQQLLIALIFLTGRGNLRARISGSLLLVGIASYLAASSSALESSLSPAMPVISLMSITIPYFLWLFAKDVFESPMPPVWVTAPFIAVGLVVWGVFNAGERVPQPVFDAVFAASRVTSLIIVVSALWMSATGKRDDLLERRRSFRPLFVSLVAIQASAVLLVELVMGDYPPPGWLSMLNVVLIGLMTMVISIPLLRLREDFFPRPAIDETVEQTPALAAADRVLYDKLMQAMDDGAYRQSGLTISVLAEQLAHPEHKLRRLINQHLGFRNFSAFLNSYRVGEAQARLADPEQARTPVLTIALDLGYGSLGPFNRAFREIVGMTPTAWREQNVAADSE